MTAGLELQRVTLAVAGRAPLVAGLSLVVGPAEIVTLGCDVKDVVCLTVNQCQTSVPREREYAVAHPGNHVPEKQVVNLARAVRTRFVRTARGRQTPRTRHRRPALG